VRLQERPHHPTPLSMPPSYLFGTMDGTPSRGPWRRLSRALSLWLLPAPAPATTRLEMPGATICPRCVDALRRNNQPALAVVAGAAGASQWMPRASRRPMLCSSMQRCANSNVIKLSLSFS
jgi:hypothetical protein